MFLTPLPYGVPSEMRSAVCHKDFRHPVCLPNMIQRGNCCCSGTIACEFITKYFLRIYIHEEANSVEATTPDRHRQIVTNQQLPWVTPSDRFQQRGEMLASECLTPPALSDCCQNGLVQPGAADSVQQRNFDQVPSKMAVLFMFLVR